MVLDTSCTNSEGIFHSTLCKLFQKIEKLEMIPNSSYETIKILKTKSDMESKRKESRSRVSLTNIEGEPNNALTTDKAWPNRT